MVKEKGLKVKKNQCLEDFMSESQGKKSESQGKKSECQGKKSKCQGKKSECQCKKSECHSSGSISWLIIRK